MSALDEPPFGDSYDFDMAIEHRNDLLRDAATWRQRFGNDGYEYMLRFYRAQAQEILLGRAGLNPAALARMYNMSGLNPQVAEIWDGVFAQSPLHIRLGELPAATGDSEPYKTEIESKLTAFQKGLGPLLVPVALEVAIRPPPLSRQGLVQDLDNTVRTYLIPKVIEILKPVSHFAFSLHDDARKSLERYMEGGSQHVPPLATSFGVTRFEIFRLPPAMEGSEGYVQMALVNDMTGYDDLFSKIDEDIDRWRDSLQ